MGTVGPLPPEWEECFDDYGNPYFYNQLTGNTQWERPFRPLPTPTPKSPEASLASNNRRSSIQPNRKADQQDYSPSLTDVTMKSTVERRMSDTSSDPKKPLPAIPKKSALPPTPEPNPIPSRSAPRIIIAKPNSATIDPKPTDLPSKMNQVPVRSGSGLSPLQARGSFAPVNDSVASLPKVPASPKSTIAPSRSMPSTPKSSISPPARLGVPQPSHVRSGSDPPNPPPKRPLPNPSRPLVHANSAPDLFPPSNATSPPPMPSPRSPPSYPPKPMAFSPPPSSPDTSDQPRRPTPMTGQRMPGKLSIPSNIHIMVPNKTVSPPSQRGPSPSGNLAQNSPTSPKKPLPRRPTSIAMQGISVCARCNLPLKEGDLNVTALDKKWHRKCFVCQACNLPFQKVFTAGQGKPYHLECCCSKCKGVFEEDQVKMEAGEKFYHKDCFVCSACKQPFTESYTTKNKEVYHPECWAYRQSIQFTDVNIEEDAETSPEPSKPLPTIPPKPKKALPAVPPPAVSIPAVSMTSNVRGSLPEFSRHEEKEKKKGFKLLTKEALKMGMKARDKISKVTENSKKVKPSQNLFNGVRVIARVDFPGNSELLTLTLGDSIFILNHKSETVDADGRMGGGSGLVTGYSHGKIGLLPLSCLEIPERTESSDNSPASFRGILEVLTRADMSIVTGLCDAIPREEYSNICKLLAAVFQTNGTILELTCALIQREVEITHDESTLFRANSVVSNLTTAYFQSVGRDFLRNCLLPGMTEMMNSGISYEIEPGKPNGSSANLQNLENLTTLFLNNIMNSIDQLPPSIRNVCYLFDKETSKKFPEAKYTVVGGFIFLRVVTPAVVSPEGFGVIDVLEDEYRRPLLLVSKMIQNISNARHFKEEYMIPLNSFVDRYIPIVRQFFDKLSSQWFEGTTMKDINTPLYTVVKEDLLHRLHFQLEIHLEKIATHVIKNYQGVLGTLDALLNEMAKKGPATVSDTVAPHTRKMKDIFKMSDLFTSDKDKTIRGTLRGSMRVTRDDSSMKKSEQIPKPSQPLQRLSLDMDRGSNPEDGERKLLSKSNSFEAPIAIEYPAVADYETKTTAGTTAFFKVALSLVQTEEMVPILVEDCIHTLENRPVEGMFRKPGEISEVVSLRNQYDRGERPNLESRDPSVLIDLMKSFFKDLPKPLVIMTRGLNDATESEEMDHESRLQFIINELTVLPDVNYYTLWRVMGFLFNMTQWNDGKMTPNSLAVIWAPHLKTKTQLLLLLITNFPRIFNQ